MKRTIFLQSMICLLAVSCTVNELDQAPDQHEDIVFYATIESNSEQDTRVYLDHQNLKVFWNNDDRISIFNKSTLNQQYQFTGETGKNSGEFHRVNENDDFDFGAGNNLNYICAVYPYQESTTISNSGVLTLTLPEKQTYKADSFGIGANTMVSVTDDELLQFKNVGGFLAFMFYGGSSEKPVSVSSIRLVGNNGEALSGEAKMTPVIGQDPRISWGANTGKSILLDCGKDGVQLGTTPDDATIFWMVVPPTYFSGGINLLVSDTDGNVFYKKTTKEMTINRNVVLRVSPIQVNMSSVDLSIDEVYSAEMDKLPSKTAKDIENRTFTVTMPTLNRSHLVLKYEFTDDCSLLANGLTVVSGETPLDVSKPVTLTVLSGNYGKNYTLIAKNTGLPIVRITTTGFTLDDLENEKNAIDSDDEQDHRTWHSGTTVRIEYADGSPGMTQILEINHAKVPVYEIASDIKGRGNYTWTWDKKPYALKFSQKREVLGMPAHKRWILLANWRDRTLLRNDAAFWLSREAAKMPYTVRGEFVELEFNGEYRGNYYLCEQIKIDENRVNITEIDYGKLGLQNTDEHTGGYLMEIDSYFDEVNKFKSSEFTLNYMFKEPDEEALTSTDFAYMQSYINNLEYIMKSKSGVLNHRYEDYLDVESAINFMLLNELTGNRDFFQGNPHYGPHSTYLYKDSGNKLYMGPIWDFDYQTFIPKNWYSDSGNATSYKWRGFDNTGYYYYWLCHDSQFVGKVKSLWSTLKTNTEGENGFKAYITQMASRISLSQQFDEEKWPFHDEKYRNDNHDFDLTELPTYQDAVERLKDCFDSKVEWMNTQITSLKTRTRYNWPHQ